MQPRLSMVKTTRKLPYTWGKISGWKNYYPGKKNLASILFLSRRVLRHFTD